MGAAALAVSAAPRPPCALASWGSVKSSPAAVHVKTSAVRCNHCVFIYAPLLLPAQVFIQGFQKFIGGPKPSGRAVDAVVIQGQLGILHLLQGQASLDGILYAIAHDGRHVAVIGDVGGIAQVPVPCLLYTS